MFVPSPGQEALLRRVRVHVLIRARMGVYSTFFWPRALLARDVTDQ